MAINTVQEAREALKKLDERKLEVRRAFDEANPMPDGCSEEQIGAAQLGWRDVMADIKSRDVPMVIRAGLRSPSPADVWLFQGGDGWLSDSLIARDIDVKLMYDTLAEDALNEGLRGAAAELLKLYVEYALLTCRLSQLEERKARTEGGKRL